MARRAAVKGVVFSIACDEIDLESWKPAAREAVDFMLVLRIGDSRDDSGDLFSVRVATPEALRARPRQPVISTRRLIVISDFDIHLLKDEIHAIVEEAVDEDWIESVRRLQRFFAWEYEGMS